MSERNGVCPFCNGTGVIAYMDGLPCDSKEKHYEAHECMTCGGTGFWGGAFSVYQWKMLERQKVNYGKK